MEPFEQLQQRLGEVLALNQPGATDEHVLVALPSYGLGESLLSHYVDRIPALEHRYLLGSFMLNRIESCEMIFISSAEPGQEVIEYYLSLVPPARRSSVRARLRCVTVPDASVRSVAEKLLDRPDIIASIRDSFAGRPAFIEPWNVTEHEVEVALRLGAPINGTDPRLWPLGYKSAGRKLFSAAGIPVPLGAEDVRTIDDVLAAVGAIKSARPEAKGVVIKHDNSGAGDGNVVIHLAGAAWSRADLRRRLEGLPTWYLKDLRLGGVVEELITGEAFSSPSMQIDLHPSGAVVVVSSHEQVLGGAESQVYMGCRFPADPEYAADLAHHGRLVGERLAGLGALGRVSVDFAAARNGARWDLAALEINLRKGGTTHPYATLRNLVPGHYEPDPGRWVVNDGSTRAYRATDNLVSEDRLGTPPADVIAAIDNAGLRFAHDTGTGVVLHMLSCLAVDGRLGLTAIGTSPAHAEELYEAAALAGVDHDGGRS
ncbi:MAG: peptide ligase PGM1-related protein [Acidimicrobiales bacterium]